MSFPTSVTVPARSAATYDLRRPTVFTYTRPTRDADFTVAYEVTFDREVSAGVFEECPPEYRLRGEIAGVDPADLADTLAELGAIFSALPPDA